MQVTEDVGIFGHAQGQVNSTCTEREDLRPELQTRPSTGPEGGEQGDELRGHAPADGISPPAATATTKQVQDF
jgi:hypothetical protein